MPDDTLRSLMRHSDRKTFRFAFADGGEMLAKVVSDSHVDEDDTLMVIQAETPSGEAGWQLRLTDIQSIVAPDGRKLYIRACEGGCG